MKGIFKHITPLLVVLVLWLFPENRSQYLYPTTVCLMCLAVVHLTLLLVASSDEPVWEGTYPVLAFWSVPIGIFWFLSERREERLVSNLTLPVLLVLFAVATMVLLKKSVLKKNHTALIVGILLTWGITFFSGSSGSAEPMRASFSLFGLSAEAVETLVVIVRKLMHVSFYGSLAWLFYAHFRQFNSSSILKSFLLCLTFAGCDEYRQSMMPNREGTLRDVLLDMTAVCVVLGLSQWRYRTRQTST